jgi:hypothetical protein
LRFDHAAMGDSDPRPGGGDDTERLQADMSEAMAWLAKERGIEQFVVVGLCSGVTGAHNVAVADPRVKGAVFIDGYTFPTRGFHLRNRLTRYLAPQRWIRYARRRITRMREGAQTGIDEPESTSLLYTRGKISHDQFRADIRRMSERDARLLFIYTGTVTHNFNHSGQLYGMIGRDVSRKNIEVDRFAKADHLFSSLAERKRLIERICAWIVEPTR